ncbi:hypothetical protein HG531_004526 [Fusarium graminearum]|nr:hypothetical protein HG531_004526 [Fusarium graminearum]
MNLHLLDLVWMLVSQVLDLLVLIPPAEQSIIAEGTLPLGMGSEDMNVKLFILIQSPSEPAALKGAHVCTLQKNVAQIAKAMLEFGLLSGCQDSLGIHRDVTGKAMNLLNGRCGNWQPDFSICWPSSLVFIGEDAGLCGPCVCSIISPNGVASLKERLRSSDRWRGNSLLRPVFRIVLGLFLFRNFLKTKQFRCFVLIIVVSLTSANDICLRNTWKTGILHCFIPVGILIPTPATVFFATVAKQISIHRISPVVIFS